MTFKEYKNQDGVSKYAECALCEHLIECTTKSDKADICLNFTERKDVRNVRGMDKAT